jgi:hypothetical protein
MIRDSVGGETHHSHRALHEKYGPIVRIAPNQLSFNYGSQAWQDVYGFKKTGNGKPFKDPMFYGTPYNGVHSVITADDANHSVSPPTP